MPSAVGSGILLNQPEIQTRALECSVLEIPQEAGLQHVYSYLSQAGWPDRWPGHVIGDRKVGLINGYSCRENNNKIRSYLKRYTEIHLRSSF